MLPTSFADFFSRTVSFLRKTHFTSHRQSMSALTPMLRRLPCTTLARVTSRLTATCRCPRQLLQHGPSLIAPAPRGLVSSVTRIRYHSQNAHELNPPPCGVKLSPEQPMNHEFHRHSTRYSRTSREVLEALDKNWMDQPHYEPVTWQLGSKVGFFFTVRMASTMFF